MIENQKQYQITKEQAKRTRDAIAFLESGRVAGDAAMVKIQVDAMKSLLKDLEDEISVYEGF